MQLRVARNRGRAPMTAQVTLALRGIEILPLNNEEDMQAVVRLKAAHLQEHGHAFMVGKGDYVVAKHKLTGEVLGCMSVTLVPSMDNPAHGCFIEDFFIVDGRWGKLAGRALLERVHRLPQTKYAAVAAGNDRMLRLLTEKYAMTPVATLLERKG